MRAVGAVNETVLMLAHVPILMFDKPFEWRRAATRGVRHDDLWSLLVDSFANSATIKILSKCE
jgi:hypothetical protein